MPRDAALRNGAGERVPPAPWVARLAAIAAIAGILAAQERAAPERPVTLRGRVVTWDGAPVAGASIHVGGATSVATAELLQDPPLVTDAQGRFEVASPVPAAKTDEPRALLIAARGFASLARPIDWRAAAETPNRAVDLDDIVVTVGQRLSGRVRSTDGKPIAGVLVVARDLFEHTRLLRSGPTLGFSCCARTDAAGIFDLPCALPQAAVLEFALDGFYRESLQPVAAGSPLEVALERSGRIQGRLLDAEGRSIAGAELSVAYEARSANRTSVTGADGSFALGLEHRGRYCLRGTKRDGDSTFAARSAVLDGPRENLELLATKTTIEAPAPLEVRAVVKATREAVAVFAAVGLFEEYANQNAVYREQRLHALVDRAEPTQDGKALVPGPGSGGTTTGAVRVIAPGFAPATRLDVAWHEPDAAEPRPVVTLELEPEATVLGTLRDEDTGEPIAGAGVFARPRVGAAAISYDGESRLPKDAATSAADGTFRLAGLGEGSWHVHVRDPRRPRAPPTELDLAAGEQKADLTIRLPGGATVAGRLVGTPIGPGWRVLLSPLPRQFFGDQGQTYYSGGRGGGRTAPVAADGTFVFEGTALDTFHVVVHMPSPPRLGGGLWLPIDPVRVRRAGVRREFECSDDLPGAIRGTLAFPAASIPFDRVVVVARAVNESGRAAFTPYDVAIAGRRSFVARDGSFELQVGPGTYQLAVVDVAIAAVVFLDERKSVVAAGRTAATDLSVALVPLHVDLVPAAGVAQMAAVDRIEVRIVPKNQLDPGGKAAANDAYDAGAGFLVPTGQTRFRFAVPPGEVTLLARSNTVALRVDSARGNNPPLGRAQLPIAPDAADGTTCRLEIGAPPEIPPPDDEKGERDDSDR